MSQLKLPNLIKSDSLNNKICVWFFYSDSYSHFLSNKEIKILDSLSGKRYS